MAASLKFDYVEYPKKAQAAQLSAPKTGLLHSLFGTVYYAPITLCACGTSFQCDFALKNKSSKGISEFNEWVLKRDGVPVPSRMIVDVNQYV